MANIPSLTADCDNCLGLCCVALAFDAGEAFAIDKPAGLPCPNLDPDFRCAIYARLDDEGFSGCAQYECNGAGQRVVQEVFPGQSWRTDPTLASPMIDAFSTLRQIHTGIELLLAAQRLDLPESYEAERLALLDLYAPDQGWEAETLAEFGESAAPARLAAFLPGLRDFV